MSQQELLSRAVEALRAACIDYMAVGSIVSSLQGEPRLTHDIDIVVALTPEGAARLAAAFPPPDYYLDLVSAQEAIARSGQFRMFNMLDNTSGDKVDFWILGDEPYDRECFARRYEDELLGVRLN